MADRFEEMANQAAVIEAEAVMRQAAMPNGGVPNTGRGPHTVMGANSGQMPPNRGQSNFGTSYNGGGGGSSQGQGQKQKYTTYGGGDWSYFNHDDPTRDGWFKRAKGAANNANLGGKDYGYVVALAAVMIASVLLWVWGAHSSVDWLISMGWVGLAQQPWAIAVYPVLAAISFFEIRFCPIGWRGLWRFRLLKPQDGAETLIFILWFVIAGIDVQTTYEAVAKFFGKGFVLPFFAFKITVADFYLGFVSFLCALVIAFLTEPLIRRLWPRLRHVFND